MTVESASFSGSKSCYGVVREVVGFEGYESVIIGSLYGNELVSRVRASITVGAVFILAFIAYVPDCDIVYVLSGLELVGKSDSYKVIFTEVGDRII